jgi:alpha-D-ribose 1-methylphosphonate 5-triphosphate synthase subunit PhnG
MARLPQADVAEVAKGWRLWALLPPALRTGLASVVVLGGFTASFLLSGPQSSAPALVSAAALDAVPQTELVGYLLTSGARVESADLAALADAHPSIAKGFLEATDAELTEALDAQPSDETMYL